MRSRLTRFIAPALLGLGLSLLSGCGVSSSPTAQAWERSATLVRSSGEQDPQGSLVASDGLGNVVFAPETAPEATQGRSTFANVPND